MPDDPAATCARHRHAIDRRLGAEVLVLLGGTDAVHRLAGPAALVWEALARPGSRADVADRLRRAAPAGIEVGPIAEDGLAALLAGGLVTVGTR